MFFVRGPALCHAVSRISLVARSFAAMSGGPLEKYLALKAAGEIRVDPWQDLAMQKLDELVKQVIMHVPGAPSSRIKSSNPQESGSRGSGSSFLAVSLEERSQNHRLPK